MGFLMFFYLFAFTSQTFASTTNFNIPEYGSWTMDGNAKLAQTCGGELIDPKTMEKINKFKEEEASLPERFLISQAQGLFTMFGVNSISNAVFGNPYCLWAGKEVPMSNDGVFTLEERDKIINPVSKVLSYTYVSLLTLAILLSSLKFQFNALSPQSRSEFWKDIYMWVISALFLGVFPMLMDVIFQLNIAIVQTFNDLLTQQGIKTNVSSIIATGGNSKESALYGDVLKGIGTIFTYTAEWVLAVYINFVYVARKVIIMLLLMMSVIAGAALLYARTRYFFGVWMKELLGNVFMQSMHAMVLYAFSMMAHLGAGTFMKLGMMIMFIPISGLLSKWLNLGDNSTKFGSALTMTGLAGVSGMLSLSRQMGTVVGGVRQGVAGGSGGSLSESGGGFDGVATSISEAAAGTTSGGWQKAKQMGGLFGSLVGMAGGSVLGPAGTITGGAIGNKVGQGSLQAMRNLAVGSGSVAGVLKAAKNYQGTTGQGFKGAMSDIGYRRQFTGNLGEAIGTIFGSSAGGAVGRSIGHALSGVSRNRLMQASGEVGGFNGMTLDNLASMYPGAQVQFRQDKMGSAFYMNTSGSGRFEDFQRISPLGAADPTLNNGETRVIDYKLNNGSPLQLQPNGTFKLANQLSNTLNSSPATAIGNGVSPFGNSLGVNTTTPLSIGNNPIGMNPLNNPLGVNSTVQPSSGSISIGQSPLNSSVSPANIAAGAPIPYMTKPVQSSVGQVNQPNTSPLSIGTSVLAQQGAANTLNAPGEGGGVDVIGTRITAGSSQTGTRTSNEVVGLSGSTPHVLRQSNAYIVGADPSVKLQDTRVDASRINPDSYFVHSIQGADIRTGSDKMADLIYGSTEVAKDIKVKVSTVSGWKDAQQNKMERPKKRQIL